LIIAFWVMASCQSNEKKIITHYQGHSQQFDELVDAAYQDPSLLNQKNRLVSYEKLNDQTKEALEKLNLNQINYVILEVNQCHEANKMGIEILFDKNWHLQYEPCGKDDFSSGNTNEVGFIESWKIGREWYVWVNNDFIG